MAVSWQGKEGPHPRGLEMKRKGHPNIPDFSAKRAAPPAPDGHVVKPKQPALPTVHGGKPHSTSKKSGRRGGWETGLSGSSLVWSSGLSCWSCGAESRRA